MSVEVGRDTPEQEEAPNNEVTLEPERNLDEDTNVLSPGLQRKVVKSGGLFSSVLRGLSWPFRVVV